NGAAFAKYRDRSFKIFWPHCRCGFDEPERTILKLESRDRGVFRFDAGKCRNALGEDTFNVAHHPFEQVDVMAGLICKYAPILRPRTAPSVLVIVILCSAPPNAYSAEEQPSQSSGIQCFAQL